MSGDGRASPSISRRQPYEGSRRKLVLAFDVGTTFSGVSYSILDPGRIPTIKGVTQFPAQEGVAGGCKIPTIIYYDQEGKVRAVGAEATQDEIYESAEEGNWIKAEWFKLHLRSEFTQDGAKVVDYIPPLPPGKTAVDVIADFLTYLFDCTAAYIRDTHPNGRELWQAFLSSTNINSQDVPPSNDGIYFVLSHPNGWGGKEQSQMREAAAKAQLIPDSQQGQNRIKFVTEGEATLHFAVQNRVLSHIQENQGIVVVDAGGGTIDVSTYKREPAVGVDAFEEIAAAQCYFHGSVFVTIAARDFLKGTLAKSPFLDDLDAIVACFDKTTKIRFRNNQDAQFIRFGGRKDNDPEVNIRFGQLKLEGTDVATFFQASVECVVKAVTEQMKKAPQTIQHVVLAGGFSASSWLFSNVRQTLTERGLTVIRPENNVVKAVSDGAVSFYLDHFVQKRIAKVTYGTPIGVTYDSNDAEHRRRSHSLYTTSSGQVCVKGGFRVLLNKGTQVREDQEFTSTALECTDFDPDQLRITQSSIIIYQGTHPNPTWMDVDAASYTTLFNVYAEVPIQRHVNSTGRTYYKSDFEVMMMFGLTELKAYLKWRENGVVKKSPAKLIYD